LVGFILGTYINAQTKRRRGLAALKKQVLLSKIVVGSLRPGRGREKALGIRSKNLFSRVFSVKTLYTISFCNMSRIEIYVCIQDMQVSTIVCMTHYWVSIIYISPPLLLFDAICPAHIAYKILAAQKLLPPKRRFRLFASQRKLFFFLICFRPCQKAQ
jgi:hypothetical protein